jgi:peptide/nickel transport system permease protein
MFTHRQKLVCAAALLAAIYTVVLTAGFFAPSSFAAQNRHSAFEPPTAVHFWDAQGAFHARPFIYATADRTALAPMYPLRFFIRGADYKIAGLVGFRIHLFGVDAPAEIHLMGTDGYGRDQFSRFLYGGQISLLAGLLATVFSLCLAVILGGFSGFYGGWIDEVLMRGGELFLALPWLYLLFAVRAELPLHISQTQVFLLLVSVMGLIGWARPARLIRGVVLSAKQRNFVTAARGFGASDTYLLRKHVLPQAYGVILTQMTLLIPQYVLAEVTLSFLGLGVGEPMASWGTLLASLQQYYILSSYWWMFLPALLLVPLFLIFYTAADALQEIQKSVPL